MAPPSTAECTLPPTSHHAHLARTLSLPELASEPSRNVAGAHALWARRFRRAGGDLVSCNVRGVVREVPRDTFHPDRLGWSMFSAQLRWKEGGHPEPDELFVDTDLKTFERFLDYAHAPDRYDFAALSPDARQRFKIFAEKHGIILPPEPVAPPFARWGDLSALLLYGDAKGWVVVPGHWGSSARAFLLGEGPRPEIPVLLKRVGDATHHVPHGLVELLTGEALRTPTKGHIGLESLLGVEPRNRNSNAQSRGILGFDLGALLAARDGTFREVERKALMAEFSQGGVESHNVARSWLGALVQFWRGGPSPGPVRYTSEDGLPVPRQVTQILGQLHGDENQPVVRRPPIPLETQAEAGALLFPELPRPQAEPRAAGVAHALAQLALRPQRADRLRWLEPALDALPWARPFGPLPP